MDKNELDKRLIDFSVAVYKICSGINRSDFGKNLTQQLIRSATSPALSYGEALGAESQKDFIHKLRFTLKELRESYVILRIIEKSEICSLKEPLSQGIDECNQLISIFVASIKTAQKKI